MITGAHFLLYSKEPEADRAFFRDVLNFRSLDIGGGWLLFALPPAEMAVHPGGGEFVQKHAEHDLLGIVLYLMCDDLPALMRQLEERQIPCSAVMKAEWGTATTIRLPSGGAIGLYQPSHPTALKLSAA
jgi:hypothetical protein